TLPIKSINCILKSFIITKKNTIKDIFNYTFNIVIIIEKNIKKAKRFKINYL
ncbi:hypothetical protein QBC41DRAFT_238766, partial [Cercophora samala]